MIEGFSDSMIEQFQNADKFDDVFEEMGEDQPETFKNASKANIKKKKKNINNKKDKDNEEDNDTDNDEDIDEDIEEENIEEDEDIEEEDKFDMKQLAKDIKKYKDFKLSKNKKSKDTIEGFQGSRYQLYYNQNLLLKCLLFGILFYILASPKTYTYTNKFIPVKIDCVLLHTIIFTLIVFIVYQLI
jgi:hypothetical protein